MMCNNNAKCGVLNCVPIVLDPCAECSIKSQTSEWMISRSYFRPNNSEPIYGDGKVEGPLANETTTEASNSQIQQTLLQGQVSNKGPML